MIPIEAFNVQEKVELYPYKMGMNIDMNASWDMLLPPLKSKVISSRLPKRSYKYFSRKQC